VDLWRRDVGPRHCAGLAGIAGSTAALGLRKASEAAAAAAASDAWDCGPPVAWLTLAGQDGEVRPTVCCFFEC